MEKFCVETCGCKLYKSGPCSNAFTLQHFQQVRSDCAGMDRVQLDYLVLGHMMATTSMSKQTRALHHIPKIRERSSGQYLHEGIRVYNLPFLLH